MTPQITFIRWQDASHGLHEARGEDMGLSELEEVGFVLNETDKTLTLGMEREIYTHEDDSEYRLWLTVPQSGIVERYTVSLAEFLKWVRRREAAKRKKIVRIETVAVALAAAPDGN